MPGAAVPPDTVVAVLNGRSFTAGEVQRLVTVLPSQFQAAFKADPKQFLRDHAWLMLLQDYASKNKLDQQMPLKEQLEFSRLILMSQAGYNYASHQIDVPNDEQQKYYDEHKAEYREARVRMIYIPFTDLNSEGEAKAKAENVVKRAKSGEDWTKLLKENSAQADDTPFAVRATSSQPPEKMRQAILALAPGEITGPLRHDNGYYVFLVESADVLPFEKVREEVYKTIHDRKFKEWEQRERARSSVQFQNEAFFQTVGKEK